MALDQDSATARAAEAPAQGPAEGGVTTPAGAAGAAPSPLEQELAKREALCEQAERVAGEKDWHHGPADLRRLADEWRSLRRWHDPREDALWRRFDAAREAFYQARDEARDDTRKKKEALAAEAERLAGSTSWKQTAARMREMMDEWKAAGTCGHEVDEELWQRFDKARKAFNAAREEDYARLEQARAKAKAVKEQLVEEARRAAVTSPDWKGQEWRAASQRMKDLMARWKAAGVADRADNDRLWEEFTAARQPFFDAQHAHYEALEAAQRKAADAKRALVEEARALAAADDFSREATERAKDLDRRWKQLGFAGRELNDTLWEEFNKAKEGFWDKKRVNGEARHEEWRQRTQDAIDRRQKRISDLQQQADRLQERLNNAYATDHVEEMQDRLEQKLDLIDKIKAEVEDIKSRLD